MSSIREADHMLTPIVDDTWQEVNGWCGLMCSKLDGSTIPGGGLGQRMWRRFGMLLCSWCSSWSSVSGPLWRGGEEMVVQAGESVQEVCHREYLDGQQKLQPLWP